MILKKKSKKLITILIPRHINRVNKIIREIKKFNLNVICHSEKRKNLKNTDIYLVDSGGQYEFGTTDVTRTISLKNNNRFFFDHFF